MAINVFEGARRIVALIAFAWVLGVIVIFFVEREPRVDATYVFEWPDSSPMRTDDSCNTSDDKLDWKTVFTTQQTKVHVTLCFKPKRSSDGKMVFPYKIDRASRTWWGDEEYSTNVSNYFKQRSNEFRLPNVDEAWADDQYWPSRFRLVKEAAYWLFGGLLALWLLTILTGWIVRGFFGRPSGQDRSP